MKLRWLPPRPDPEQSLRDQFDRLYIRIAHAHQFATGVYNQLPDDVIESSDFWKQIAYEKLRKDCMEWTEQHGSDFAKLNRMSFRLDADGQTIDENELARLIELQKAMLSGLKRRLAVTGQEFLPL